MTKKAICAAIDVGTTKVCTIVANISDRNIIQVLGTGVTHAQGMHKGMVVSIGEVKDSIRESVKIADWSTRLRSSRQTSRSLRAIVTIR